MSGGARTKVVALGIGDKVKDTELNNIASAPASSNVIRVQDFTALPDAQDHLVEKSCKRQ